MWKHKVDVKASTFFLGEAQNQASYYAPRNLCVTTHYYHDSIIPEKEERPSRESDSFRVLP